MTNEIRTLDLFCGSGGSSFGAKSAGATIVGGVDTWPVAASTFSLNYPNAQVWTERVEDVNPSDIKSAIGPINLLLASPECTNHSPARGKRLYTKSAIQSRSTAIQVCRFARVLRPRWIVVENVVSMKRWSLYLDWKAQLQDYGYNLLEVVINSKDFGVPQSRRRLFILGDLKMKPVPPPSLGGKQLSAKSILQPSFKFRPLNRKVRPRSPRTLDRVRSAIASIGETSPFLIVYYGSDATGGWQSLDRPLRTVTTHDRFALVVPTKQGYMMRMLQPPELMTAMGFPDTYLWPKCNRQDLVKLLGNAVVPPVMKAIVTSLCRGGAR